MTMISIAEQLSNRFGFLFNARQLDAACGCTACDDGVEQGHFACSQSDALLLQAERLTYVVRAYDNGWKWFVSMR